MNFKNKSIVITGSSRGIGWALARACAKQGAKLYLVQRSWNLEKINELKVLGASDIIRWTCDLSQLPDVKGLCSKLSSETIDILVNNAGILTGELLEKQTDDEIQNVFQMNLTVAALLSKAVLPNMLKQRSGRIVNNTSVSAYMRFPCATTYAAAKSGLLAMTECLDTELAGTGVSALALITPGIKTDMFDEIKTSYGKYFDAPEEHISPDEYAEQIIAAIKKNEKYLLPSGQTRIGLWIAKYAPSVFKKIVVKGFVRSQK